jgi:hypothetical protein
MFSYYIELGDLGWLYSGQQKEWKENVFSTNNQELLCAYAI